MLPKTLVPVCKRGLDLVQVTLCSLRIFPHPFMRSLLTIPCFKALTIMVVIVTIQLYTTVELLKYYIILYVYMHPGSVSAS